MFKVGIIGSGFGLYGLLPAFNSIQNCKVVAICGKKTDRLVEYSQTIGLKKMYTDWQIMLDYEELDLVAIAVTPKAQYEIAKVAIEKGLHIFAEKPLAANYTQAKELLELAEKKKIKHAVDFIFPEIEEWSKVKKLLERKTLGKLIRISLNWNFLSYAIKNKVSSWKTDVSQGGGALSFYFSHSLYYLESFAGRILNLKSHLSYSQDSKNGGEVGVDLLLRFKNQVIGDAHFCCSSTDLNKHQLIFICENGKVVLENEKSITSNFSVKIYHDGKVEELPVRKKGVGKYGDERVEVVKKLAERFIDSIVKNKKFIPSFKEGVRVQELIEKIRRANV